MQSLRLLIPVLLVSGLAGRAVASEILQNEFNAIAQISSYQPIGQSFVAPDSQVRVAIAFGFEEINPGLPNTPLVMRLYQGEGFSGSLLSTASFSLQDGFTGFYDVDFSSVVLVMGTVYTAAVSVPSDSELWAVQFSTENPYPLGRLVTDDSEFYQTFCGSPTNTQCADLRFRIMRANVPEPGTWALLVITFGSVLRFVSIRTVKGRLRVRLSRSQGLRSAA